MQDEPGFQLKVAGILAVAVLAVIAASLAPPIAQDPEYHDFADQRRIWGIPNFWNVLSNLPFLGVGTAGVFIVLRRKLGGGLAELRSAYLIFFVGVGLVTFGSGYYHLAPSNPSLAWDRLPMTLGFMAFFAAVVGESVSLRTGTRLLWPLLVAGILSVFYWRHTEIQQAGDLRPYALVQFLPLLLTPLILLLFRSPWKSNAWIWAALGAYLMSKAAEVADAALFEALGGLSGHNLKHLAAALGALAFLAALVYRTPAEPDSTRA